MIDILKSFILPSNICFLLIAAGLVLSVPRRTRRPASIALVTAGLLLVIFSSGKTASWLMSPLEYAYPVSSERVAGARAVVILAAYAANDPDMSLSDRPNSSALYRVVEGALLAKQCPGCRVVVTGTSPTTDIMAEVLVALGVPRSQVDVDSAAPNTGASAANLRAAVNDAPFYLVTSAGHLPRAMAAFVAAGLHPIAAPTDHQLPKNVSQAEWRLSPFHLQASDLAVHERVGMWWYRWRGVI
jgi:uncharacterized SAM-binding protein YcdF (DUF218 family)